MIRRSWVRAMEIALAEKQGKPACTVDPCGLSLP